MLRGAPEVLGILGMLKSSFVTRLCPTAGFAELVSMPGVLPRRAVEGPVAVEGLVAVEGPGALEERAVPGAFDGLGVLAISRSSIVTRVGPTAGFATPGGTIGGMTLSDGGGACSVLDASGCA